MTRERRGSPRGVVSKSSAESWQIPNQRPATTCVAVGHVTHDWYPDGGGGGQGRALPGGCAYYAVQVWKHLGSCARLVTSVGRNFAFCGALEGVSLAGRGGLRTTAFYNHYPHGAPRQQWVRAQAPRIQPTWAPASFLEAEVVFLAPVLGEVSFTQWVWRARSRGRLLGVGLQGFLKGVEARGAAGAIERRGAREPERRAGRVVGCPGAFPGRALELADVVFLSQEDLQEGPPAMMETLRSAVPVVVKTLGRKGAAVYAEGRTFHVGIYETSEVVDPTGAGDTFAAAFLLALSWGATPMAAARLGSAASSIIIEGQGAEACHRLQEAFERYGSVSTSQG